MASIRSHWHDWLRKLGKYLKTDIHFLLRGAWSLVAQVAVALGSFALAVVVGHFLPKDVYGEYKYVLALVAILSAFGLNNLGGAVLQSAARGYDGALQAGFWENIRWSALIFFGALIGAVYYFANGQYEIGLGMLVGGSLTPFMTSANLYAAFLAGKGDFVRQIVYFDILGNLIPVGLLMATVLIAPRPIPLIIVYFVSNTLIGLLFYMRTMRIYKPDSAQVDTTMLSYGKHLSAMGIIGVVVGNLDQVLLFHFVGAAQLAVYSFATAIPDQAKGPMKTFDAMIQSRFAKRANADIDAGISNKFKWLFAGTFAAMIAYIAIAKVFFAVFFPAYSEAVVYSQVYALSLLSFAAWPAASYLSAKKHIHSLYLNTIGVSLFQLAAMFTGVLYAGLWGLVIARVATKFVAAAVSFLQYRAAVMREEI